MYLALRKCKNDCKVFKIIQVSNFCPLKPDIARFPIGFRLNLGLVPRHSVENRSVDANEKRITLTGIEFVKMRFKSIFFIIISVRMELNYHVPTTGVDFFT